MCAQKLNPKVVASIGKVYKGKGILFNVGGQTGKDCLLTRADGVKVADRRDRTRNLSLRKRCTNHCTTGSGSDTRRKTCLERVMMVNKSHFRERLMV